jgi:hypothetical protein
MNKKTFFQFLGEEEALINSSIYMSKGRGRVGSPQPQKKASRRTNRNQNYPL